jgi:hypothetical protein
VVVQQGPLGCIGACAVAQLGQPQPVGSGACRKGVRRACSSPAAAACSCSPVSVCVCSRLLLIRGRNGIG